MSTIRRIAKNMVFLLATNLVSQTNMTSFTDTNAAGLTPLFYRVGVP